MIRFWRARSLLLPTHRREMKGARFVAPCFASLWSGVIYRAYIQAAINVLVVLIRVGNSQSLSLSVSLFMVGHVGYYFLPIEGVPSPHYRRALNEPRGYAWSLGFAGNFHAPSNFLPIVFTRTDQRNQSLEAASIFLSTTWKALRANVFFTFGRKGIFNDLYTKTFSFFFFFFLLFSSRKA